MSQAREAQESLGILEKSNAPIVQQVEQAALFAGISLSSLKSLTPAAEGDSIPNAAALAGEDHHGRREWSLRWLLKKMQDEARRCPDAWRLLCWLVRGVPVWGVARALNERKFGAIVRQSLEEAVARRRRLSIPVLAAVPDIVSDSTETIQSSPVREKDGESKTARGDYEMVEEQHEIPGSMERDTELTKAIHGAIECVVRFSIPNTLDGEERSGETFAVEYMKAVIRTTNDEAAKILGAWLELCITPGTDPRIGSWLLPFIEIWSSHIVGANDTVVFANHCLRPLLVLLSRVDQYPLWKSMLEQLLARYFIIPAKAAYVTSKNTDLLSILVGESVSIEPLFAPILFDVAIRSLQPSGTRLRPQQDAAWLVAIFTALGDAIRASISTNKSLAVRQMLQSCLDYQVRLDLVSLRGLVLEFALLEPETDWHILAITIRLDSNVFLITKNSEQALTELLDRITLASLKPLWLDNVIRIVDDVLVPLMGEFAKARDLAGFVHHWYEKANELQLSKPSEYFHAWEDEALQVKMRDIMEVSMTTQQIVEVFQWTRGKIEECPNAAFVILDAISGAVTRDETINAVTLEYWKVIQSNSNYLWRKERFSQRLWRIANRVARWHSSNYDYETSDEWALEREVFCELLGKCISPPAQGTEQLRCGCRWWTEFADSCDSGSGIEISSWLENIILFDVVGSCIKLLKGLKTDPTVLGDERWGDRTIKIEKGTGWSACTLANMVLVEYPRVLEYICLPASPLKLTDNNQVST
jgi:nucleolar pre-ribosomal-associated protein 2